jgi:ribosome-binding factor A
MRRSRRDYPRSDRVGDQMQRELADLVRLEVKDPRVGMLTLTSVEVSRDLAHAKVFFTLLDGREKGLEAEEALNHAAGFLRKALGLRMRLRSLPNLRFIYDNTPEEGARISALIASAIAEDEARHVDDDTNLAPDSDSDRNPDASAGSSEPGR